MRLNTTKMRLNTTKMRLNTTKMRLNTTKGARAPLPLEALRRGLRRAAARAPARVRRPARVLGVALSVEHRARAVHGGVRGNS